MLMATRIVKGVIARTDLGDRYFLNNSDGVDPTVCINDIACKIAHGQIFIECVDMYGKQHFINASHLSELFTGEYSIPEVNE